jgi:transposase, IS5 family
MARINPEIIKWARDTAGLDPADAANKLGLKVARGIAAEDRLLAIEAGDLQPTRRILSKMSKLYRRPLLIFYMSAPPRPGERGKDFRTLPAEYSRSADALVDALVRDITARQQITRAILLDEEDALELPFVGSMTIRNRPEQVLASICEKLGLEIVQYRNRRAGDKNSLSGFNYLRRQAEKAGVFVLLIGNLGSHHTSLDVEVFRGFALADKIAPFVVINDQDSETSWSFTLLHELAHIWLGQTGVSGDNASAAVEQFCNEVAGEFLIPKGEIREIENFRQLSFEDLVARIGILAEEKNVSMSIRTGAMAPQDTRRVIVDTTVQPKNVMFPTDAKLLNRAREKLVTLAKKVGLDLRQSYTRVGKFALIKHQRYAHAKQFKRAGKSLRKLKTYLGRTIRDIGRQIAGDEQLQDIFRHPLHLAGRVLSQKQKQVAKKSLPSTGSKVYSLHAPEVECIGKGKAHKPYEFGVKVSIATTLQRSKGGLFALHAKALPGNPYDGHTLATVIPEMEAMIGNDIDRLLADAGYRGHNAPLSHMFKVYTTGQKRRMTPAIKREMRRRAAVEPVIGHIKNEHRMERNYLAGTQGDAINAILAAAGYNFRLLLTWLRLLLRLLLVMFFGAIRPLRA